MTDQGHLFFVNDKDALQHEINRLRPPMESGRQKQKDEQ